MTARLKSAIALTVFLFILSVAGYCFAVEKSVETTPGKEEVAALLKDLAPDLKVLEIKESPVKGLWEVSIQSGERKGLLYLDSSRKYIIQGAIFDLSTKTNLTQEKLNELNKVDVTTIPLDDALVLGEKDAKYKVIVFDDPD
jgi:thiol:disulfide interchange protein DsbC